MNDHRCFIEFNPVAIPSFQTTIWTIIRNAKNKDESAIKEFVTKYRYPIENFIMLNGFSRDEAEDISQDVFLRIFQDKVLEKADEKKGKFRTLLLAITKNMIKLDLTKKGRLKRGGDKDVVSLDNLPETIENLISSEEKEDEFDRLWMVNIMKLAMDKLNSESNEKKIPYYEAVKMYLYEDDIDYNTIAQRLGKTLQDAYNYIHRGKLKLMNYIQDIIKSYCSTEEEYNEEIRSFSRYFKK